MSIAKRARVAYEPYGVVGVIGAGSAPFAQPLGQIAGALLAGNGVVFKPAAASVPGRRADRAGARPRGPARGARAARARRARGRRRAGGAPVGKVLFTGSPAVGREVARACVSREKEVTVELGGKDAMLVLADAHLPRAVAGALWAGCAGAGQARGSIERVYVAREVSERFLARLVQRRGGARRRRPRRPGHAGRPARLRAARWSTCASSWRRPWPRARGCTAAARSRPPGCDAGAFYAPGGDHRRDARDAPAARADRRAGAGGRDGGLGGRGDRAGQRRRLQPGRVGVDGRPLSGHADRARAATRAWCGSTTTSPARPSRAARGGPPAGGGLGRTLGEAGLRACAQEKLITWTRRGCAGCGGDRTTQVPAGRARAVAKLRSARESDRERAWRHGAVALARVGARAVCWGRGGAEVGGLPCEGCPPRPTQARSASASCAGESATRAACRGCSTPPSTSPA